MRIFYAETISQALAEASQRLSGVTSTPRLESEMLLAAILNCSRVYLHAHPGTPLSESQNHNYTRVIARRVNHEPLPYITGKIEFYNLEFIVTPEVLIPRPETEQLVEVASAWLAQHADTSVVDVGTGSGCIAVSLARYAPGHHIMATDISWAALQVAQRNADKHRVSEKVTFINCDLLRPVRNPVDVIVSNPPYVANHEFADLQPSVQHEPRVALLAGIDGLDVIRKLLNQAACILSSPGLLLVELGAKQGKAVLTISKTIFPDASVSLLRDLTGVERVLCVRR